MNAAELHAENQMLRSALQEAHAERDIAVQQLRDQSVYEPRVRKLHLEGGEAEIEFEPDEAFHFLASLCVRLLHGAPNFKTAEVLLRSIDEKFNVSVSRIEGKSIAATIFELRYKINRVRELAARYRDWNGSSDPIGPLHGAGMVLASNGVGKELLEILDEGKA